MNSMPLLAAKFYQPVLARRCVTRPHLVQRLEAGLTAGRPLTLISAPAGYGKSTLAAEWLALAQRKTVWLSLEEADDDPARFFAYFVAALQPVAGGQSLGAELAQGLAAGQMPPQPVLVAGLVNGLAELNAPCLCVLDDFQWIQDPAILNVMQELVTHAPPAFHLVLTTREDPALPLARWRARGQLSEIRAADLRFDAGEAGRFLREGMGLVLSEPEIALLEERTEGWPAGLQLAGLSLQGRANPAAFVESLSGSHRFILGYLTEEVLKNQPPAVQDFLLQTAILPRLTGELCNALTGRADSADLLEKLLAANLFLIPLDDEGHWYRYHHLFADLLRGKLRSLPPQQLADLHLRASRWYEAQDQPAEAIEQALAAAEPARALDLIERFGWELLNRGGARQMEAWLQALPPEWRARSPRTCLDFAWMHLLRGSFAPCALYLQQAEAALSGGPSPAADLQAECLALRANLLQTQGQAAQSIAAARRALELAAPQNARVQGLAALALGGGLRQAADYEAATAALQLAIEAGQRSGDGVTEMLAVSHLTLMSLQYGRLRIAAQVAQQSIDRLERRHTAPSPIVGAVHGALGLVYFEWNQFDLAQQHLERGIHLGTFSGHNASLIYTRVNLARLQQAQGNLAAASQNLAEAAELLRQGAPGWVRPEWLGRQVSVLLAQGDPAAAEAWLRQSGVSAEDEIEQRSDPIHLAWLRLLYMRQADAALGLARRLVADAEAARRNGTLLQALILGALIQAESAPSTALEWLTRAWVLAEPEGYRRSFADEGAPMAALLRRAGYPELLALFPALPAPPADLVEPLSERELEVLRLLAAGLSYAETAARLVISLNTVRYHIKSIYGKLGVEKQAHALARARALGLLQAAK